MTSSFTFNVSSRSTTASRMLLTGTTTAFPLQFLTINRASDPNAVTHGSINTTSTVATIVASQAEFAMLASSSLGVPFSLVVVYSPGASGWIDVSDLQLPPGVARRQSDVRELAEAAAAFDEHLAYEMPNEVVGELRALNRRVASIEKLLVEARDGAGELRATGTDLR